MKRCMQYEPLIAQQLDLSSWSFPMHTHNHFELILIRSGSGHHVIDGNRFRYQPNDVFFLGPLDKHYFVIDEKTRFDVLSFTESYLAGLTSIGTPTWLQIRAHSVLKCQQLVGSIVTDWREQQNLSALVDIILAERNNQCQLFSNPVVESIMRTILSLVDRQLTQHQLQPAFSLNNSSALIQRIVTYVWHHITEPDCLRIEKLADVFHYSQSHLSALFKQQAGESIQQYIIRYKLKLVETRLGLSTMTISQIADELGFTDVCHLNKLFKRYYQQTPTNYRRGLLN